jgi:hypothetical protein
LLLAQRTAVGPPVGQDTIVLLPIVGAFEGTEEHVSATADAVRQGDDGLAALLVETILGGRAK